MNSNPKMEFGTGLSAGGWYSCGGSLTETMQGSVGDFWEARIMAEDVIFVRRGEELVSLAVAPYEAEAVLQGLLEH